MQICTHWKVEDGLTTAEEIRSSITSFRTVRGDVDVSIVSGHSIEYVYLIQSL